MRLELSLVNPSFANGLPVLLTVFELYIQGMCCSPFSRSPCAAGSSIQRPQYLAEALFAVGTGHEDGQTIWLRHSHGGA